MKNKSNTDYTSGLKIDGTQQLGEMVDQAPAEPLSPAVTEGVRQLYSPPGGEYYWQSLESRVMATIGAIRPTNWWQVVNGWAGQGLMAAAVAVLMIAGMLLLHANQKETETAFIEAIYEVDPASHLPLPSAVVTDRDMSGLEVRGATFRDVISQ